MSLLTLNWALNVPVKTPEQRVVLLFLAEFSNTDDQVICEIDELCERIPISREALHDALEVLCAADIIRVRPPIRRNTLLRATFNLDGI